MYTSMEILNQIFMTAIAAFAFVILIAKLASAVNNDDDSAGDGKLNPIVGEELKLKTEKISSKIKSKKKVRFAVDDDDDEFVVNKAVWGPSETKQVAIETNREEELIISNEIDEGFDGVEDQIKEGKSEKLGANGMKLLCDDEIDEDEKEKEGLISSEEDSDSGDWEGIERSELEKVFAMAADYGKAEDHLQGLGSDIQMRLYGLHKVAMEGPCHEAQPLALKMLYMMEGTDYYARNAWHELGNMSPDMAMEQYISLLSAKVPEWSQGIHSVGLDLSSSNSTSIVDTSQKERGRELESGSDGGDLVGVSDSVNEDKQ